jgi:hypothetical protein
MNEIKENEMWQAISIYIKIRLLECFSISKNYYISNI